MIFFVAVVLFAGYTAYSSHGNIKLPNVTLANLEALADENDDGSESEGIKIKCYSSIVYELGASVVSCADCLPKTNRTDSFWCIHDYCFKK